MSGRDIQEVYRIGYRLGDVKTTLKSDISLSSAGVSGKRGEVINMARWVGEILRDSTMANLEEPDAATELKQALAKEQMVGEYVLASLDAQFYIRQRGRIVLTEGRDRDGLEGLMMDLLRMRRGKIIRLADSTRMTGDIKSKISIEERILFEAINRESRQFEERVLQ